MLQIKKSMALKSNMFQVVIQFILVRDVMYISFDERPLVNIIRGQVVCNGVRIYWV